MQNATLQTIVAVVLEIAKKQVREFWNAAACGEELYLPAPTQEGYANQSEVRYRLEPYIVPFANFDQWNGKRVLEIGVGLGADHQKFAEAGAELVGVDLTEKAIKHTRERLALHGLQSDLQIGDAENLNFPDGQFDLVYSWGVIHHSPDTARVAHEIVRVLKPGGRFRVMIYNKYSIVGFMLWVRYGLMAGRPRTPLSEIYARYMESPGTKAYTRREAAELFSGCEDIRTETVLTHGDLLEGEAGQRHTGLALSLARALWPREVIRRLFPQRGLFMLISGEKPMS